MKIYISADMEGITGVNHWDEVTRSHLDYPVHRKQMGAEVTAACKGGLKAGAHEIWVKDAHASGRNILPADLPRHTRLIRGWSGHPASMVQELDDSFDALIFIGYHSRAGCGGNPLAHTMSSSKVERLWINDRETSEFLLFGYWAAALKVPIALVTGDEALTREVQELNPRISTVAVKKGFGDSTVNLHPVEAREQIQVASQAAVSGNLKDCLLELPSTFKLRLWFVNQKDAYRASYFPRCELIDDKTISFNTESYFEVLRLVLFVI